MSQARTLPSATPATTSAYSATWAIAPRPVAADGLEAAGRADDRIAAVKAVARRPFVAEREVVLHGIRRVDLREPPRDLLGHPPVARLPARQTDRARDVLDVGVHRDQEPRWRDPGPEAEVGRLAADHPAEEEMEPLARAARRRQREQMTIAAREASAAEHLAQVGLEEAPRETLERMADGPGSIGDRKSTRLNSSHGYISYAVFC